jgi:hypothetical protein
MKRKIENVQAAIEPDLVYPLLQAKDVKRWQAEPSVNIIVTHELGMRLNAIPEDEMKLRYPKTYAYLKRFESDLRQRSAYKRYFKETAPFYSMFDIGDYTFASYKVIWMRMASKIMASVVKLSNGKPIIPPDTVTLVPFDAEEEAYYLCAVVNSSPFDFAAQSYSQRGGKSFASPHILENIHVPKFNPKDKAHLELAGLSEEAHTATALGEEDTVALVEGSIDELAAEMWGLTKEELKEIQDSLAELKS